MALEETLLALLRAQCPRAYYFQAPPGVAEPYVIWQHYGGRPWRDLAGRPGNLRNVDVQITVYHSNASTAMALSRQIDDALHAAISDTFVPEAHAEPGPAYDDLLEYAGTLQRFSIWGER